MPEIEAAAPDRDDDRVEIGHGVEHLEPTVPCPAMILRVVERGTNVAPVSRASVCASASAPAKSAPCEHDLGAVIAVFA